MLRTLPSSWKKLVLNDIVSDGFRNGYSPNCPDEPNGNWILSLGNMTDSGFNPKFAKPAPLNDAKVKNFSLKPGDFLISRSNTLKKVGRVIQFNGELENCSYPDLMIKFRIDSDSVYNDYLEFFLRSELVRRYIEGCASGTSNTMVKINKEIVKKIPIILPPIQEQKAIANHFSYWDEAIEKNEKLIEANQLKFKWLLNELIGKPATELREGWKRTRLGEVLCIPKKKKIMDLSDKQLIKVKLHCQGIELNNQIKPKYSKKGRPYFKRLEGELIIGRQNFHNGGFGILPDELDGMIASNAITSLKLDENQVNKQFLLFLFSDPNYYKRVGHIMDGTGQKELSEKQILKLRVMLPSILKQEEISDLLILVQNELNLLKILSKNRREQKRELMQKLFTAVWRVKYLTEHSIKSNKGYIGAVHL